MSETTVPGDLLPGLLRENTPVRVERHLSLSGWSLKGATGRVVEPDPDGGWLCHLHRRGNPHLTRMLDKHLVVDLTKPTGWDAAVDALARHYWPDMGETERAVFFHDEMRWFLLRPFPQQTISWRMDYRAHQPHEALRCVLHHVAGVSRSGST